jgi:hypothetical protein
MPDPVPTTDTAPGKPKLSKGVIIALGAGGAILLYYLYKKKKEGESGEGTPYTSQSFIPVTSENVAGVGAPGSAGGSIGGEGAGLEALIQANKENNEATQNYLRTGQEAQREQTKEINEIKRAEIEHPAPAPVINITGGGPPAEGQKGSSGGSGGGGTPNKTNPPPASTCPSAYPISNGQGGCYKNIKCGNGCEGHQYSNHTECQQGEAKHKNCHW